MNMENKLYTLCLNSAWQPLHYKTVKDAFISLFAHDKNKPINLALDIEYGKRDGKWDFTKAISMRPVAWEEWLELPLRDYDNWITTVKHQIRVPTVIIASHFNKMPMKLLRPTKRAIWVRDNGICQYTGEKLTYKTGSLDHVIPKSRGGKNTFDNLVLCSQDINSKKGNRLNSEAGLKLLKTPDKVGALPASALISEVLHVDHKHFLTHLS